MEALQRLIHFRRKPTHMRTKQFIIILSAMLFIGMLACSDHSTDQAAEEAPSIVETRFTENCSGCHGAEMQAFADRKWKHGKTRDSIMLSIKSGYADAGMPSFDSIFTDDQVAELADYILEGIQKVATYDFQDDAPTSNIFPTESGFSLELDTVATDLESVWGMTFLPDGDMVISDKNGTLYRHSPDNPMRKISGVPEVRYNGQGGLLDVEIHPDFANNNTIYFSYSKFITDTTFATVIHMASLNGEALEGGKISLSQGPPIRIAITMVPD